MQQNSLSETSGQAVLLHDMLTLRAPLLSLVFRLNA